MYVRSGRHWWRRHRRSSSGEGEKLKQHNEGRGRKHAAFISSLENGIISKTPCKLKITHKIQLEETYFLLQNQIIFHIYFLIFFSVMKVLAVHDVFAVGRSKYSVEIAK